MNISPEKTLTVIDAARLMFRTKSPSQAQVSRIQKLIKAGALSNCHCEGPPLNWTTTAGSIAEYLAKESLQKQTAKHATSSGEVKAPSIFNAEKSESENEAELKSLYEGIWRDYFLSVFLRRKAAHHSKNFKRAVLAGQVLLLVLLVGTMVGGVRLTMEPVPPERSVVELWLEQNTEYYSINEWFPPEPAPNGPGKVLRVKYSYHKGNTRPIQTDRYFLVQGGTAQEIDTDD